MRDHLRVGKFIGLTWLLFAATHAMAAESAFDLRLPQQDRAQQSQGIFLLAENDAETAKAKANLSPVASAPEFDAPTFSKSNMHKYLGLGTVVLAGLTAMSSPGECEDACATSNKPRETNGTHANLAKATVAMAAATIATGLYAHWDDFSFEDGWSDPDTLHVMLATAGAVVMAYAVNKSASSSTPVSHAGEAELGALAMVVAIKLTW